MPKLPQKPQVGQKALQSIYNTVCDIVDYLPAVTVRGDGNTTAVDNTPIGTIVHARPQAFNMHNGNGSEYYAGSGIQFLSGNIINAKLSAGPNINIDYNSGWLVISGTPAASGGGGSDTNDTYIGDANYYNYLSGNHIFISPDANYNGSHLVSSTLNWLQELNNERFCENGRVTFPTTSHVITSDVGVNSDHCIVPGDLIHDGLGTTVNYSWMRSPFGDELTAMVGSVNGLQVDLTLSGGKYADVVLYQNKGGFGPVSHETEPPTQSTINVLLSGDGDVNPATGHIFIRDVDYGNGTSGGIIYTDLQGGGSNIPTPEAGKILSCDNNGMTWQPNTGGGGGPVTYVSGFYPNWGHGNHDSVVIPSNDSYSAPPFTMAQNGWIYAWASFNPSYDGFRYSSYRAHVIVGGAWFKVCELLLPFQKAELTLSSSSNIASQIPNGNYTRYPEGDVTNKFYLSGTYYDQQKEENVDFMVQCTRSEGNDQYETLYDGNNDQSGRNYTKFAWGVSNRPTENFPNILYTDDQFITSNSYYDIYYKDQNDDFQPLYYLDGISNTMGKKSEDYTYFAWKNGNNDIVFSRRYGGMHQNIGAPTEYSISTLIYNYQNYIEYQETPLTSNRINFQNVYDNTENDYWVKATASNVSDIAIGVGAAITIPARKGKSVQFKVETDNNGTYSVPISYGQQYGSGPFPVACVVYYDDPPEE